MHCGRPVNWMHDLQLIKCVDFAIDLKKMGDYFYKEMTLLTLVMH
jgi:hypothetical protein